MSKIKMVHKCYWFLCVYTDLFCFFFGVKGYKTEDFSAQYTAVSGKPGMSRCGWRLCHRGWRRFAINWNKEKVTNHQNGKQYTNVYGAAKYCLKCMRYHNLNMNTV